MILLSQVSPGMNLSGRYLYFSRVVPTDAVEGSLKLGTYTVVEPTTTTTPAIRIRIVANVRYLEFTLDDTLPTWTSICNSSTGWSGSFGWTRLLKLPSAMESVPDQGNSIYTWLPYIYFVSVLDSRIDRPTLQLHNIASSKQPGMIMEKSLMDAAQGEDLTNKIIVFDPDTIFASGTESLVIGNPLPVNPWEVSWYIKFTLFPGPTGKIYEVTAGVRGVQIIQFYLNDLGWVQNWIDLKPVSSDERFLLVRTATAPVNFDVVTNAAYICSRTPPKHSSVTLEIVKSAAVRMHIPEPSSVIAISTDLNSSDADNAKLLLSSLNQTLKSLAVFANWPQMFKEITFMAIQDPRYGYNPSIGGFSLEFLCPSYDGIVSPYMWAASTNVTIPQATEREFNEDSGIWYYRILANHICFNFNINQPVKFTYKTKYIVKDVSGQPKEFTDADDDECIFDAEVCILGTIVSFKSAIGQDPTIETNLFDRYTLHMTQIIGSPAVAPPGR